MYGYPETIVIRHLMAQPTGPSSRDRRPAPAPAPGPVRAVAQLAVLVAFLLVAGLGLAFAASLGHGHDAAPQAQCATKMAPHKGGVGCR